MLNRLFVVFGLLVFWASCSNNSGINYQGQENYYLPIDQLKHSDLLMEYRYLETGDAPFYWLYNLDISDEAAVLLQGQQLDVYGELLAETQELLVENGVVLKSQNIIERDTQQLEWVKTEFDILSDDLFLFGDWDTSSKVSSKISFASKIYQGQKTTISKDRQFLGDTTIIFQDKSYAAKQISVNEWYDIEEVGHLEFGVQGIEVYALGLGLVYVKKFTESGQRIEYYLHKCEIVDNE